MISANCILAIKALLILSILVASSGCDGVRVRNHSHLRAFAHEVRNPIEARRHDELEAMILDRERLAGCDASVLEAAFENRSSSGLALVLAERSYRNARYAEGISSGDAIALDRDAAAYASIAIATAPGDQSPELDRAIEVHNASLANLIRSAQGPHSTPKRGRPTDWRETLTLWGVGAAGPAPQLDPGRVTGLVEAADYEVVGLDHRYIAMGLGVPLVARFANDRDRFKSFQDRRFPERPCAPATAVLRVGHREDGGTWRGRALTLELVDPFAARAVSIGNRAVPLAADRTAAQAVQLDQSRSIKRVAFQALLNSSLQKYDAGLYASQPYRAGKIPVVLVHGLNSSPMVWGETLNELTNDPWIADNYQFWTFFYATGEPISLSGSRLRDSLRAARENFDPSGLDQALDEMVLVGHSMGGLLIETLVKKSGLTVWDATMNIPYPADRLSAETREELEDVLIFRPEPYVSRAVFVATPHTGSPVAAGPLGRLSLLLARPRSEAAHIGDELDAVYGPGSYNGGLRGETFSVRNLNPESKLIRGLASLPIDPSVTHHSIILQLDHPTRHGRGDGVVPYASAHLDSASSEGIVPGNHLDVSKPEVTDEIRRILRLHLQQSIPNTKGERACRLDQRSTGRLTHPSHEYARDLIGR